MKIFFKVSFGDIGGSNHDNEVSESPTLLRQVFARPYSINLALFHFYRTTGWPTLCGAWSVWSRRCSETSFGRTPSWRRPTGTTTIRASISASPRTPRSRRLGGPASSTHYLPGSMESRLADANDHSIAMRYFLAECIVWVFSLVKLDYFKPFFSE